MCAGFIFSARGYVIVDEPTSAGETNVKQFDEHVSRTNAPANSTHSNEHVKASHLQSNAPNQIQQQQQQQQQHQRPHAAITKSQTHTVTKPAKVRSIKAKPTQTFDAVPKRVNRSKSRSKQSLRTDDDVNKHVDDADNGIDDNDNDATYHNNDVTDNDNGATDTADVNNNADDVIADLERAVDDGDDDDDDDDDDDAASSDNIDESDMLQELNTLGLGDATNDATVSDDDSAAAAAAAADAGGSSNAKRSGGAQSVKRIFAGNSRSSKNNSSSMSTTTASTLETSTTRKSDICTVYNDDMLRQYVTYVNYFDARTTGDDGKPITLSLITQLTYSRLDRLKRLAKFWAGI